MSREKCSLVLFVLLSGTFSVAFGDEQFGMRITTEPLKTKENTHYRFQYFVKDDVTGDYKTQEETKEGDSVSGSYTVAEPNGDLRTVTYTAGPKTGFNAKVNVKPTASPIRTTKETTPTTATLISDVKTTNVATTEKGTTVESNVQRFPGGFIMDILKKPLTNTKTEMGMTFSLNTNFPTEPVTSGDTTTEGITTEKTETSPEPLKTTIAATPTEGLERQISENSTEDSAIEALIEKELDEVENSMPKLPELIFSDNKTHFKFYKDPEEAILDERITQIARQLAETSLRREYEERKLGHILPISVTSIEPITSGHLSKSFKFTRDDTPPPFRPTQPPPIQILTHLKLIPQYIYKEPILPTYLPANQRFSIVQTNKPPNQWDQQTYETVTNIPKVLNKSELQVEEIKKIPKPNGDKYSTNYDTTDSETVSVVPIHIPTLLQFITTRAKPTEKYFTQKKTEPQLLDTKKPPTGIPLSEKTTTNPPPRATLLKSTTTSNKNTTK